MEKKHCRNRAGGEIDHGGAIAGSLELWFLVYNARFDEREAPGERGGDGDLTGTERKDRGATAAAWRSTDGGSHGGAWG